MRLATNAVPSARPFPAPGSSPPARNVHDLWRPLGLHPKIAVELDRLFVRPRHLVRRERLFRSGEPFSALHAVRRGSMKTVVVGEDGREQITGYHMTGDIIGLEGLGQPAYPCDAIALEDSEVSSLPFTDLDRLALDPRLAWSLFELMARDLRRSRDLILLLGTMSADERVSTFLVNLLQRQREHGGDAQELMLRMTREEIASFLGLKLETVSRVLSRLNGEGFIQVQGRAVKMIDLEGLGRLGAPEA